MVALLVSEKSFVPLYVPAAQGEIVTLPENERSDEPFSARGRLSFRIHCKRVPACSVVNKWGPDILA